MIWLFPTFPIASLCFFALAMVFISLWVHRSAWLWGAFLFIAYVLAYEAGMARLIALLFILPLLFFYWLLKKEVQGILRALLIFAIALLSIGLLFHALPGFCNWEYAKQISLGHNALPYSLWINFDKPLAGLALAFTIPLIQSKNEWKVMLLQTIPLTALALALLIPLALCAGIVVWDFKIPPLLAVWIPVNLLFVCIPEEAFFRGFIQRELFQWWGGAGAAAHVGSVLVTALLFTLFHIPWIASVPFLLFVFLAGIIYGGIYQYTQKIESSIFCHFTFNLAHIVFFTYPVLI